MIPVAEAAKGVILSPSASEPGLAASSNRFFRVYPSDEFEATLAAQFLVSDRKATSILVLEEESIYTRDWSRSSSSRSTPSAARSSAGCRSPIRRSTPSSPRRSPRRSPTRCSSPAIRGDPDHPRRGAQHRLRRDPVHDFGDRDARDRQPRRRPGGGDLLPDDQGRPELRRGAGQVLRQALQRDNYDRMPDLYAAHGYDAAQVALKVLAGEAPKSSDELMQRLLTLQPMQGVTGAVSFDAQATHPPAADAPDRRRQGRGASRPRSTASRTTREPPRLSPASLNIRSMRRSGPARGSPPRHRGARRRRAGRRRGASPRRKPRARSCP